MCQSKGKSYGFLSFFLFRFLYVADKGVKNIHLFAIEKTFCVNKILIFINFNPKLDTFIERISLKCIEKQRKILWIHLLISFSF